MYTVKFIRSDGKKDECYYYKMLHDAEYHFHLFDDDDSDLYLSIILTKADTILQQHVFTK